MTYFAATPGTTYDYWALVADNPNLHFRIQEDGVTTPLALADIGTTIDFIFTHGGNTASGISGAELDSNTKDADATRPCKIISLANEWDVKAGQWNTPSSANSKWIVMLAAHQLANATIGI